MLKSPVTAYQIEKHEILFKAYQLLSYFLANEKISRIAAPDDPLKVLESRFFDCQTSLLLLEIAILYRSFDDQIRKSVDSRSRREYLANVDNVNDGFGRALFSELTIRECCNKIIHADIYEPWFREGEGAHKTDVAAYDMGLDKEVTWHHHDGTVQVAGKHHGESWAYLIDITEFVEAIAFVLGDRKTASSGDVQNATDSAG